MKDKNFNFVKSLFRYERQKTAIVQVGEVKVGGEYPVRLQSMTDTDTTDTDATVEQIIQIIKAGADFVRMAVQGLREAENLKNIRAGLDKRGYAATPLVADIHFSPQAAKTAIKYVRKVRINPGNFYDPRAKFQKVDYTDDEYRDELAGIEERFIPFLKECAERGTALRIGANHGSLSDRIMSRYGDTPAGIVESVMEFLRICKKIDFHNVVISIKASNTRLMVYTVRLMNYRMRLEGMNYPFHIGVTEAGEGEDGRIKSAVGSGALLADGIGDTVRVSLTEDPANEIGFARKLVDIFKGRENHAPISAPMISQTNPFEYERRSSRPVGDIGGKKAVVVIASLNNYTLEEVRSLNTGVEPDYYFDGKRIFNKAGRAFPILSLDDYLFNDMYTNQERFIRASKPEYDALKAENPEIVEKLKNERKAVIIMESDNLNSFAELRAFFMELDAHICKNPVILHRSYREDSYENLLIKASTDLGGLLIDGYGDGILLSNQGPIGYNELKDLSFGLLQASRMRVTRTEFVSCPGCGRTLFELQGTLSEVKKHFRHLNHLKIGVMGCVVNGPGEMGDVDYGYVGSGPGHINLYKGQKLVKRHVPSERAVDELKKLMMENGDWYEPVVSR
ncbi:4-hydroxy-3-methylbut-2-en-1-yl diphosphate synthase (flavodoxin) [Prolixibacter sp. SD074]|jgi:(E)-4-hydroxy-3-methylbut-2-enyl-diphosphate synthase|nr:4-hydroxy-3-methylbut-2-en-1-yl diphosphate synthase (flavodoxin) [Prolixibacter sp. SD074]